MSNDWGWGWDCCCDEVTPVLMVILSHDRTTSASPTMTGKVASTTNVNGSWSDATIANLSTNDNVYAVDSWDSGVGLSGDILELTKLNYCVPPGATITGITVYIQRKASAAANLKDLTVQMIVAGSPTGDNKASATTYLTSDANATYGGSSDLWSLTLTPDIVNSPDFGFRFQPQASSDIGAVTVSVDIITIQLHYTANAHVTAFNGESSDVQGPGTPLWIWDAGTPAVGAYEMGRPIIDGDGNVYIPYVERTVAGAFPTGKFVGHLAKLDRDGTELWTYTSDESSLHDPAAHIGQSVIIDPADGEIIYSHPITDADDYFATRLDTSGAVVTEYAYDGSFPGGLTFRHASQGLAVDSSGNILFVVPLLSPISVFKMTSAGVYDSEFAISGTTANIAYLLIDDDDKAFVGTNALQNVTRPIIVSFDVATMTEDWRLTAQDFDADADTTVSRPVCATLGLDGIQNYLAVGLGALVQDATPDVLLWQLAKIDTDGNISLQQVIGTSTTTLDIWFATYDPVSDHFFAAVKGLNGNFNHLYRFDNLDLDEFWSAYHLGDGGAARAVKGLAARTV